MVPDATHKHLFYTELAKLLEAGFDIRKAAAVLRETSLPAPQAVLLKDLEQGLESGSTITGSFGKDIRTVSDLERAIIGAGERGGKLGTAFQHLADYFGLVAATRREILSAMIYPLVVLHMGIFIATVPTALMAGETFGAIVGRVMIALGITYAGGSAIALLIRMAFRAAPENAGIDRALRRIPWIGNARQAVAMARFCKVYHSGLLASLPMAETVRVSSDASHSGALREAGRRLEASARAGDALGPGFLAADDFPKAFSRSYATGEEAGTLDVDLARWARYFQEETSLAMRKVAVMVPKFLYFLILGFVAWKIIAFFNGYYSGMLDMIES